MILNSGVLGSHTDSRTHISRLYVSIIGMMNHKNCCFVVAMRNPVCVWSIEEENVEEIFYDLGLLCGTDHVLQLRLEKQM